MKDLKQFMKKNAYKLVYASIVLGPIIPSPVSVLFFGEIPFPAQEYKKIRSRIK